MWLVRETLCTLWCCSKWSLVYIITWDDNDKTTSTWINWWLRFTNHGYRDIKLMMWTHVSEHGVRLTHSEILLGLLFYMCHQLVSSDTPTRSLDLRSSLFLTVRSGALWGCQTLLRNWVAIKAVFECFMKHGMGCVRIKMEFAPPNNGRDISVLLEIVGLGSAWPCQCD